MSGYQQPPYGGMPYAMPPQPPQHASQLQHQSGPLDPRNASMAGDAFHYNTGLPSLPRVQPFPPAPPQHQHQLHQPAPPQPPPTHPQPLYQQYSWSPGGYHLPPQNNYPSFQYLPPPHFFGPNGVPIPPPPPTGQLYPGQQPPSQPSLSSHLPVQTTPASVASPHSLQAPPIGNASASQPMPPHPSPRRERFKAPQESDKEEGEVSDVDAGIDQNAGKLRNGAQPPRSVPQSSQGNLPPAPPHEPHRRASGAVPPRPSDSTHPIAAPAQPSIPNQNTTDLSLSQRKKEGAKKALLQLIEAGVTPSQLVEEGLDASMLGNMFQELDITLPVLQPPVPTPTSRLAPTISMGKDRVAKPTNPPEKPSSSVQPALNGSGSVKGPVAQSVPAALPSRPQEVPSKPSAPPVKTAVGTTAAAKTTLDRNTYIARLQALKSGKSGPVKATPSPKPSTTQGSKVVEQQTSSASTPDATQKPQEGVVAEEEDAEAKERAKKEEQARKTELVRQKILALQAAKRAEQSTAPRTPSTPPASQPPPPASVPIVPLQGTMKDGVQKDTPSASTSPPSLAIHTETKSGQTGPFPSIPGLFMNTPLAPQNSAPHPKVPSPPKETPPAPVSNTRKRPVASDFDVDVPPRHPIPEFTRPLGQSPHQHDDEPMIIDVSSESEGSEMEVDEEPASKALPVNPSRGGMQTPQQWLDLPTFSTQVSRPASAFSTPPPAPTLASVSLKQAEDKIAELRRKIQEREQQKKKERQAALKPNGQSPAGPQQLEFPSDRVVPAASVKPPVAALPPAAGSMDQSAGADTPVTGSKTPTVGTPDWRKQRRAEIRSSLGPLDATIATDAERLEEMQRALDRMKAEHLKRQQARENLAKELESLGVDTEGMPDEEMQAKKDQIIQERAAEAASHQENTTEKRVEVSDPTRSLPVPIVEAVAIAKESAAQSSAEPVQTGDTVPLDGPQPSNSLPGLALNEEQPAASQSVETEEIVMVDEAAGEASPTRVVEPQDAPKPNEAVHTNGMAPVPLPDVDVPAPGGDTPVKQAADIYSPEPIPVSNETEVSESTVVIRGGPEESTATASQSGPKEAEAGMSEIPPDDEEEYEPELVEAPEEYKPPEAYDPLVGGQVTAAVAQNSTFEEQDSSGAIVSSPASSLSDEENGYEPPDAVPPPGSSLTVPTAQGAPAVEEEEVVNDVSMSLDSDSSDSSDESDSGSSESSGKLKPMKTPIASGVADDVAPQVPSVIEAKPIIAEAPGASNAFVPYKSPLRFFKSFRYHPNYPQLVAGGYRSLTYSHQIDPNKMLCPYEAAGGVCNDTHCKYQHFRDMELSGDKLLLQLGMANPGKPEDQQQWIDGLKKVLGQLRLKKVNDPEGISAEISNYRRHFLGDSTRVINL